MQCYVNVILLKGKACYSNLCFKKKFKEELVDTICSDFQRIFDNVPPHSWESNDDNILTCMKSFSGWQYVKMM